VIVRRMNQGGADWKMSDLSSFKSVWVNPITTNYKGYGVYEMPPQTQGFATLEMLNILQVCAAPVGYNLRALGPRSRQRLSIRHRSTARRHRLPDHRRPVGKHGVVHLQHLRLLRVTDLHTWLRVPDERPRIILQPQPQITGRDCAAQTAIHDHHLSVHHEERPALAVRNGSPAEIHP
jgi:hypothetical protein